MKVLKILNKSSSNQSMSMTVNIDTTKLEVLEAALGRHFKTQVGILGDRNSRATISRASSGKSKVTAHETLANLTNAQIGYINEFGSYALHIPPRSFLRVPLMLYLKDKLNEAASKINKAIEQADVHRAYAVLGIAAEAVVQDAFKDSGPGWDKLSPKTIALKGSSAILIDSGQLRKSITSKVVGG